RRRDAIEVFDEANHVGSPRFLLRGRREVRAGPTAQVLRLADVDYSAFGVLHQVHARALGKVLDLFLRGPAVFGPVGVLAARHLRSHRRILETIEFSTSSAPQLRAAAAPRERLRSNFICRCCAPDRRPAVRPTRIATTIPYAPESTAP